MAKKRVLLVSMGSSINFFKKLAVEIKKKDYEVTLCVTDFLYAKKSLLEKEVNININLIIDKEKYSSIKNYSSHRHPYSEYDRRLVYGRNHKLTLEIGRHPLDVENRKEYYDSLLENIPAQDFIFTFLPTTFFEMYVIEKLTYDNTKLKVIRFTKLENYIWLSNSFVSEQINLLNKPNESHLGI